MQGSSIITLREDGVEVATGTSTIWADQLTGSADLFLVLTEGTIVRTLDLHVSLNSGVLTEWGTLSVENSATGDTTVLFGGWIYSPSGGL